MKCPECEQEFNTSAHTPRILIQCGHTLCETCIKRLLESSVIRCPECKQIQENQSIHSFPKNLVLLKTVPQPSSVPSVRGGVSLCESHLKRIEAFCVKDKLSLCIDCILSEAHKNHEINSVQKAAQEEKKFVLNSSYLSESYRDRLAEQSQEIEIRQQSLDSSADKQEKDIITVFDEIRAMINERESQLLRQVQDTKHRQAALLNTKGLEVEEQLRSIDSLRTECVLIEKEKEFEILQHAKERHDMIGIACKRFTDLPQYSPFPALKKEDEFKTLANQLCPVKSKLMQSTQAAQNKRTERYKQPLTARTGLQRTASKERERKDGFKFGQIQNSKSMKNQTQTSSCSSNLQLSPRKESFSKMKSVRGVYPTSGNSSGQLVPTSIGPTTPQQPSRNTLSKKLQGATGESMADTVKSAKSMKHRILDKEWYERESPVKLVNNNQELDEQEQQFVEHLMIKDDDSISKIFDPTKNNTQSEKPFSVIDQNETVENLLEEMKAFEMEQSEVMKNNQEREYGLKMSQEPVINQQQQRVNQKYDKLRESLDNLKKNLNFESQKNSAYKNFEEMPEYQSSTNMVKNTSPTYRGSENDSRRSRLLTASTAAPNSNTERAQKKKPCGSAQQRSLMNSSDSKQNPSQGSQSSNTQTMFGAITSQKAKQILTQQAQSQNKFYNTTVFSVDLSTEEAYNKKVHKKLSPQTSTATVSGGQDFGDYSAKVLGDRKKSNPQLSIVNAARQISPNNSQLSSTGKMKKALRSHEDFKPNFALGNSQNSNSSEKLSKDKAPQKQINQMLTQVKGAMPLNDTMSSKYLSNEAYGRMTMDSLYKSNEEYIYCFSGTHDAKIHSFEMFDPFTAQWHQIGNVIKPRTKFQAVSIPSQGKIWLIGGKHCDGQRAKDIEELDVVTNQIKIIPGITLPKPMSGFSCLLIPRPLTIPGSSKDDEYLLILGGNNGSVLRRAECISIKNPSKWIRLQDMKHRRDELAATLGPDGKIYVVGGYGGNDKQVQIIQQGSTCLASAERLDLRTGSWEILPNMKVARRALTAVALPDGIYVIGGYNGKAHLNSVEKQASFSQSSRYDFAQKQWIDVTPMNIPRCTLSAIASSDCQYIYAIGGFNGEPLDTVERYDVMNDIWETMPSMTTRRFMHASTSFQR